MPRYVTPDVVELARKVDLRSYLQATAPNELVRCGAEEYCTREHDSLKISHGKWYWWSRGIGGASALDYLVKVENSAPTPKRVSASRASANRSDSVSSFS